MTRLTLTLVLLSNIILASDQYPSGPVDSVTPGSLCDRADTYRYPEKIAYCERDVESNTKEAIIREYDSKFGYQIQKMNRVDFKIDHLIPLCMGGSNSRNNLWPQHKTVYVKTDLIEQRACELMAKGRMLQREAVDVIRDVKHNLETASQVLRELERRLRD